MPLVRIDLVRGRSEADVRAVADAVHAALVDVLGIPEDDRFQVISEHEPGRVIAQDAGLGFQRSDALVMIQVFTQVGRDTSTKQQVFEAIASRLGALGVGGHDVFVGIVENTAADWSFGFGRAQYVVGDLPVPARP
ncbi:phenylpyruvate tautomerase PptA (4-oxalocrotonate tautomerase family) [Saccharopolyspora erythraea NRRL 2338]|uniref:4-oxalocrotonate tautomerase n=2 Tax=Saccharopolyspora erythraea TaxID=1836 RepID=A4FIQ5_SACEN|nr:tautomerase family protein [Saccharopolyspora erythraea]EQD85892.1 tautomerase [Saccharopolyspora erythraea D]PFG97605.1 phenylpyruvate tautomerase PptA (4-oxalocrotonate tautomerase family) [Saccharopolyspora erythraea NRRL 2338]QRK87766.1 tautomerase family protein [Saccharopolyspora erythraea]CAM03930.1 4-oxalocrotonate tautomerase [Saccharopolyspora erythraea NRRL 2338]